MNRTMATLRLSAAALFFAGFAAEAHGPGKGKALAFTAQVVDTGCYLSHDTKGAGHAKCAETCARAGVPLALLDEKTGVLYLPVAVDHKNQNERLLPFIEKRVKVTGTAMDKGGMRGIALKTIDAAP